MDQPRFLRTADAYRLGVTRAQLRAHRWQHVHRGVVTMDNSELTEPMTAVLAASKLMSPTSVLTGWAAALLQGVKHVTPQDLTTRPIVIASPDAGQHRPRPGIRATRRYLRADERESCDGINVATIARAAYDLALDARTVDEAVVAFDMCTSTVINQGRTSAANLERLIARHKKTRGINRAREALSLMSARSASPWESKTRPLCVRGAGLDGLLVNVPVFSPQGELLGIADLLDPEAGLAIESDGDHHRDAQIHTTDNRREEKLERAGLTVCRVTALDHRDRLETTARIRNARLDATRSTRNDWTLDKPAWWWTWPPARRWD